jgi:hypothetical protein
MLHAWVLLGLVVLAKGQVDVCSDYGTLDGNVLTMTAASTVAIEAEACQTEVTTVVLTDNVQVIANATFLQMGALVGVTIPTSVTWIGANAFKESGVHVIVANGVTYVDVSAFDTCLNLTHVTMNSVLTIGTLAFSTCESLSSVTMPMLTLVGASAFYWTTGLESINATSITTILEEGFRRSSLSTINMPALTYIGNYGFAYNPVTTFNTSVVLEYIGAYAFVDSSLYSIDLPSTLTYIGESAFYTDWSLFTIIIRGTNVTVGTDAFANTDIIHYDGACEVPSVITELYNCTDYVVQSQSPTTAAPVSVSPTTVAIMSTTLPPTPTPTTISPSDVPTDAPSDTPTTSAPISSAPTTHAPVTISPTTVAPVTVAPSTHAPTTLAPGGGGPPPTTHAPATIAPTTRAPVTIAPTTHAPVAVPTVESIVNATNSADSSRDGITAMIVVGSLAGAVGIGVIGYNVYTTMRTTTYTQLDMYL